MVIFLLRYNELGLKSSKVRSRFQKQMIENIENKFIRNNIDCFINTEWGRIYLETDAKEMGIKILRTIFGLTSFSPVIKINANLDTITDTTINFVKDILQPGKTFALRCRRTGQHKYTSIQLAEHVGAEILNIYKDKNLKVKLTKPEVEIFIEVRQNQAYIFSESYPGPGGLPLGTQGKVASVLSNEYSYIASWLLMKRGCRVYPVYFETNSKNKINSITKSEAVDQLDVLRCWVENLKLKIIELKRKDITKDSFGLNNEEFINYCYRNNIKAICLSFGLEELNNLEFYNTLKLPIFLPLIGLNEDHIENLVSQIKTIS